jgi:DNA-binding LacI/PurR family transcriptional regulator
VESGREVAHHLADTGMPYDALCCMSDSLALGVLRGLSECGIIVPRDVAVTGFDGINPGSYITPTLTTVAVDFRGMARTAIQIMDQRISNTISHSEAPHHEIVGYELLKRESTMGINRR